MNEINYIHTANIHNKVAARAFIPVLLQFIQPASVIDVGCGLGTWLKVFSELGVKEITGIDGHNVDISLLSIPVENFVPHDLREPFIPEKKFDLSLCLEVAEHLPNDCSDNLVELLTNCSDNILFSAALPMQGGQNHINEQPFDYWVKKFNAKGFIIKDIFREIIWNNTEIDWWYRQNMFLISKGDIAGQQIINDYYHPQRIKNLEYEKEHLINELDAVKEYQKNLFKGGISSFKAFKLLIKSILNTSKK